MAISATSTLLQNHFSDSLGSKTLIVPSDSAIANCLGSFGFAATARGYTFWLQKTNKNLRINIPTCDKKCNTSSNNKQIE
jgi:hypothetical protein